MIRVFTNFRRVLSAKTLLVLLCVSVVSGCAILPGHGPSSLDIALLDELTAESATDYTVIVLDAFAVQALGAQSPSALSNEFQSAINGTSSLVFGIGDRLLFNIWEASPDGLFSTAEIKQVQINAVVDESGEIFFPYVGQVRVLGMSVRQVRQSLEDGLRGKAVEPQVQVVLTTNGGHKIAVVGDVTQPGRYDIPVSGLRLIEGIAQAGGARHDPFETEATILRGRVSGTVRLDEVLRLPANNVWLLPRDTVQVLHKPRTFTAFGAVTSQNHLSFKTETVSLAEALAQSGGLNDDLADAGGVFLFRFETPTRLANAQAQVPERLYDGAAATIYRLDFGRPQAFFLARSFMMQDKDIIYVANAPAVEFRKFVEMIISPLLGPV